MGSACSSWQTEGAGHIKVFSLASHESKSWLLQPCAESPSSKVLLNIVQSFQERLRRPVWIQNTNSVSLLTVIICLAAQLWSVVWVHQEASSNRWIEVWCGPTALLQVLCLTDHADGRGGHSWCLDQGDTPFCSIAYQLHVNQILRQFSP